MTTAKPKIVKKKLTGQRALAVRIAKDVLKWLPKTKMTSGSYLFAQLPKALGKRLRKAADKGDDLKDHLPAVQKHCEVCMLGACLLSKVRLLDQLPLADVMLSSWDGILNISFSHPDEHLSIAFSDAQLGLIESAFMLSEYTRSDSTNAAAAIAFGKRYKDRKDRAKAIVKNVIENDGLFRPGMIARKKAAT